MVIAVVITINFYFISPTVSPGFQEALVRQVRDLEELLGSGEFAWVRNFGALPPSFPTRGPPFSFLLSSTSPSRLLFIDPQVGVSRSDGVSAGEFCPIFYRQ